VGIGTCDWLITINFPIKVVLNWLDNTFHFGVVVAQCPQMLVALQSIKKAMKFCYASSISPPIPSNQIMSKVKANMPKPAKQT